MEKGDFDLYMDDETGLFGISDSDGNIIVNAEYESKESMGELYDKLILGEIDQMSNEDKEEFLDDYGIETLRVCDNCGKLMHEGYVLGGEHACCDKCAIQLYVSDDVSLDEAKKLFDYDIVNNDDDCYWTTWEE